MKKLEVIKPVTTIGIKLLRKDGGTQSRAEINQEVVKEYAELLKTGFVFPPVTAFYDGLHYWLADGFHRVEAAEIANQEVIGVDIRQGARREAVLHSVGVNATHGLRRTNADKRRAVETLLRDDEWGKWSDREIARQCGVGNQLVGQVKKSICVNHTDTDLNNPQRLVSRNGTTYSQDTRGIGNGNGRRESESETAAISPANADQSLSETDNGGLLQPANPQQSIFDPHGTADTREDDHYTPNYVWQLALECLGVEKFDLDPCSNSHHSPNVPASNLFVLEDDGLAHPWKATTLWLNPPYSATKAWVDKLIEEYTAGNVGQGIALVKGDFSTKWFQPLLEFPICLVSHRIAFINPKNNGGGAKFASAIIYFGNSPERFYQTFDSRYSTNGIGTVVQRGERGVHFGE